MRSWILSLAPAFAALSPLVATAQVPTEKVALEKRSYIKDMTVLARHFPDSDRRGKFQMMAVGDKRYMFHTYALRDDPRVFIGTIIDVSDPLKPKVIQDKMWRGLQIQVAWNDRLKKWILIVGNTFSGLDKPGLRGIDIFDVTDPTKPVLLSRYSVDGGDPARKLQTGSGTHRFWYDGGKYAYLSAAPNNDYYFPDYKGQKSIWGYTYGLQIVDLSDPSHPRRVTDWHIPGQRYDETEARENWAFKDDVSAMPSQHGPTYLPRKVEDGGKLGYGSWSSFGMVILDFSDINNPKIVSMWRPDPDLGPEVAVHTVDIARLDRGFVITNPEAIYPNCKETAVPASVVDVSDPANPRWMANLPTPTPPKDAPYKSFCERHGRFGPHNAPHIKAPGKPAPNFTCYAYFNAGLQCYDITDPRHPFITSYFIPEQGPMGVTTGNWIRTVDSVFIEWDRKLIWAATDSGLYLLSSPKLGKPILKPMAVKEWALPGLNANAP